MRPSREIRHALAATFVVWLGFGVALACGRSDRDVLYAERTVACIKDAGSREESRACRRAAALEAYGEAGAP